MSILYMADVTIQKLQAEKPDFEFWASNNLVDMIINLVIRCLDLLKEQK